MDRPGQVDAYARILREAGSEPRPVRQSRRKRAFDVALAGLGLVLSAPLWALVAIAIKLGDGGPVLFSQERVGVGRVPAPFSDPPSPACRRGLPTNPKRSPVRPFRLTSIRPNRNSRDFSNVRSRRALRSFDDSGREGWARCISRAIRS